MQQMADELVNKSYQLRGVFSNFSATVSSDDAAFFRKTSEDIRKIGQQSNETSKQIKDNASKQQKVDLQKHKKDRKEMAALENKNFSFSSQQSSTSSNKPPSSSQQSSTSSVNQASPFDSSVDQSSKSRANYFAMYKRLQRKSKHMKTKEKQARENKNLNPLW